MDYVGGNCQHKILDKGIIIFLHKIVVISKSNKKGYVIELRTVAVPPTQELKNSSTVILCVKIKGTLFIYHLHSIDL